MRSLVPNRVGPAQAWPSGLPPFVCRLARLYYWFVGALGGSHRCGPRRPRLHLHTTFGAGSRDSRSLPGKTPYWRFGVFSFNESQ